MSEVMATAKRIIANVEKVIVGKRRQIILSLVSWFCEGHMLLGRRARRGQDDARPGAGRQRRLPFQADPVYARPAADRRDRRVDLQSEDDRVRVSPRPDLRPDRAGRRNQPHDAAHAVGAAGGDGREPGDGRRRDARAAAAVSGHRHAEPDRPRGHVSRCPRPSSTASSCASASAIRHGRRAADARHAAARASARPDCSRSSRPRRSSRARRRSARSTSTRRSAAT